MAVDCNNCTSYGFFLKDLLVEAISKIPVIGEFISYTMSAESANNNAMSGSIISVSSGNTGSFEPAAIGIYENYQFGPDAKYGDGATGNVIIISSEYGLTGYLVWNELASLYSKELKDVAMYAIENYP